MVLRQVREDGGVWLPEVVAEDGRPAGPGVDRDSLYAGIGGLAPVLAEISQCRALSSTEQALSAGIAARLCATAGARADASLYLGLGGDVTALKLLAPGSERVALGRLAGLMTPAGWNTPPETGTGSAAPVNDLVLGTAGVVLAAVWAGGEHSRDIAATGGEALLRAADQTKEGLDWAMMAGRTSRMPNYSHGTAGIATALAMAGAALNRDDFIVAARHGAQHLLTVGSLADGGFIIPHTLPYSRRDVEPVTYTWCHGPAGTSQLFPALAHAGVDTVAGLDVTGLRQRCLHTILASGVPQRLRPGFWNNDGRCCGTAGVGDVLLDAAQDGAGQAACGALLQGARTMADALVERAIRDEAGARWRFLEHRQDPPLLPPRYLVDAGRRRHRGLPAPPGPGHRQRAGRPRRRPARPVVGRPRPAPHRPHPPRCSPGPALTVDRKRSSGPRVGRSGS
jgi:hypothetical protein